jgi:hypothetical protein
MLRENLQAQKAIKQYRIVIDEDEFKKDLLAKPKPRVDFDQHKINIMKESELGYKDIMEGKYKVQLKDKITKKESVHKY